MKINMFSVHDVQAKAFVTPFFKTHIGQAEREFCDVVQDSKSPISRHPEDYQLFHIGEFDDNDGTTVSFNPPRLVCKAIQFVEQNNGGKSNV